MAEILTTASELKAKSESLQELNQRFMNQITTLEETEGSLNGMWEGQARETFHNAFSSDMVQLRNFYNAIQNYVQVLLQIAAEYMKAENTNVDIGQTRKYQ